MGLRALTPQRPERLTLQGGLRVGPRTYLCDQPPDLLVPATGTVQGLLVDGVQVAVGGEQAGTFSLASLALDPGSHSVSLGDQQVSVEVVAYVHTEGTGGTAGFPLVRRDGRDVLGPFSGDVSGSGSALRGALLSGGSVDDRPAVARVPPGVTLHVLTDEGCLYEVPRTVPVWVQKVGLQPSYVDAREATAGVPGSPAFLIFRPTARRLEILEVPSATTCRSRRVHNPAFGRNQIPR